MIVPLPSARTLVTNSIGPPPVMVGQVVWAKLMLPVRSWNLVVPGVAFDRRGGRLGHGKGIYDRLLKCSAGIKIGICYEWQIIDEVPTGKDDVKMDFIVAETGILVCS